MMHLAAGCCADSARTVVYQDREWLLVKQPELSWSEAADHCSRNGGGSLASFDSAQAHAYIDQQAEAFMPTGDGYWIGGSDEASESIWVWPDGTTVGDSVIDLWKDGNPVAGKGSSNANCLLAFSGGSTWGDAQCKLRKPFVCRGEQHGVTGAAVCVLDHIAC